MTPEQQRAAHPLLDQRGHVRTQRTVWRLMRLLLSPIEHKLMREAQPRYWDDVQ